MKITRTKRFPRRSIEVANGDMGSYGCRSTHERGYVHFSCTQEIKGGDYSFEAELTDEEFEAVCRLVAGSRDGRDLLERAIRMGAETAKRSRG